MKVVIINKSDSIGGAAVVAARLLHALRANGIESKMLVMDASRPHGNEIEEYGNNRRGKFYFLAERADIFARNHFSKANLFKVSTAKFGFNLAKHPDVQDADIIYLNWINQGALSMKCIDQLCKTGKPVIWAMHDMWQLTGICHHALQCKNYMESCGNCQFLGSKEPDDLSAKTLLVKQQLYKYPNLHFVAVSNWLAERCAESTLLSKHNINVIPNAFPIEHYNWQRHGHISNIPRDKKIAVMGAARLDDPIKGFDICIKALNIIAEKHKDVAHNLHAVFFGNIRDAALLDSIKLPHTALGEIKNQDKIAEIYSASDVVISSSLFETLPGTLIEGAAAGCTPVAFGNSGQRDIIEHLKTGWLAEYLNPESLAEGIVWAVKNPIDREYLHNNINNLFSSQTIAHKYIELFNQLLSR